MSSSEPPTLEVHCVRCGEYASWTGSRTLSDEQIQQWWEQRSHVTQENGHQANTVLCLTCEALAQEKHDDDEPAKSTGEDKDSSTTIKSDKLVEKIKKLILIRHAESENNVDKREAKLAFTNLKTAQSFPTFSQLCSAGRLLTIPMNSDLSTEGEEMLLALKDKLLHLDFLATQQVELILHSPLLRAKRTCYGLFSPSDDNNSNNHTIPILENQSIFEKNITETLSLADSMAVRIQEFIEYLLSREEQCIVIVGHSAFFRAFLNTPVRLNNCEVGTVGLTAEGKCSGSLEVLVDGGQALLARDTS